jgi:hypothetical protein
MGQGAVSRQALMKEWVGPRLLECSIWFHHMNPQGINRRQSPN